MLQSKDLPLLARCVLVIDNAGIVRYRQLVLEVSWEPDYDAALAEVRKML